MKIFLASDHAGFELKQKLADFLRAEGHAVEDMGPRELNPADDYPDFVMPLARRVAAEQGTFGIVFGMSGQGEAMAANRIPGARAAVWYGPTPQKVQDGHERDGDGLEVLRLSREHNDANILSLGARFVSEEQGKQATALFLATPFSGDERHVRRISKLG